MRGCASRRRAAVAAGLAAAVLASFVGARSAAPQGGARPPDFQGMQIQPYEPPKPAPAFALPDLEGRTVRLEDFRGKAVMLFFWTTW